MNKIFDYWLKHENVPYEMKEEMMNEMSQEDIKKSFSEEKIKFGTAGYRAFMGPGNLYLNEFTYQQLTIAYGKYLQDVNKNKKQIKVLIAFDNRKNGSFFGQVIARTLTSMGINALFFKRGTPIPTPLVSYTVRRLKLDGAIIITASHNPKRYNGFKAYNASGGQLLPNEVDILTKFIPDWKKNLDLNLKYNKRLISYIPDSLIEDYFEDIESKVNINNFKKNDKVVITTHHGALSNKTFFDFIKKFGYSLYLNQEQCFYDDDFINDSNINPEDPESFLPSIEIANQVGAEIILGFDPDGDRLGIAIKHQGKWVFLSGNEMAIIATYYLLNYNQKNENKIPLIISTYVSNNLVDNIVNKWNGIVLRTGTGFKNLAKVMDEAIDSQNNFNLSFEEAIGMCISDANREKDGLASAILMLEIYSFYKSKGMSLVDLLNKKIYLAFGNWYGQTFSIKIKTDNIAKFSSNLIAKISMTHLSKIDKFKIKEIVWNEQGNCLEFLMDDNRSWIKFRGSGTEPKFKIYYNLYFDKNNGYNEYEVKLEQKQQIVELINEDLVSFFGIK